MNGTGHYLKISHSRFDTFVQLLYFKKKETGPEKKYTMRKQVRNNTYTDHVEKEKDSGVDCNLSLEHHIMEKVSKAN